MGQKPNSPGRQKLQAWIKSQLDNAVWTLIDRGEVESLLVEAKPAWALPFQILIGKIRIKGERLRFEWFICGDVPTDFIASTAAATPREAARHFAMRWQLQAARQKDLMSRGEHPEKTPDETARGDDGQLAFKAEALYALVDDPGLWLQKSDF